MSSIPLPALDVKQPQQPSILDQFSHIMSLKNLMQGQQLQQGQIQEQQQQIADNHALTTAMKNWDPKTQSYDDLTQSVLKNGGSGNAALQIKQHALTVQKTVSDIAAQDATTGSKNLETFIGKQKALGDGLAEAKDIPDAQLQAWTLGRIKAFADGGVIDPQTAQHLTQGVQQASDPAALRAQIQVTANSALGAKAIADQKKTAADTFEATQKGRESGIQADIGQNKLDIVNQYKQNPQQLLAQVDAAAPPDKYASLNARTKAQVQRAISMGDVDEAKKYIDQAAETVNSGEKEVRVAQQTQPLKIETAKAEQQAAQLIKGMSEPVYAFVPQGGGVPQKTLMSKTDALQAGIRTMLPVTEKEVGEDTMLINRLSDVHQKISRYENAMQKWDMNANDRAAVQRLTQTDKFKLGVWGAEVPVDEFNKALNQLHIHNLSGPARDALVAYYNAHEAMVGYNRVLSGSGKSSDKALELQGNTLPDISTADHDMAQRGFRDFKENLNVVGQGLPKLPGVKSPEEWEREITAPKNPRSLLRFPETSASSLADLLGAGK